MPIEAISSTSPIIVRYLNLIVPSGVRATWNVYFPLPSPLLLTLVHCTMNSLSL